MFLAAGGFQRAAQGRLVGLWGTLAGLQGRLGGQRREGHRQGGLQKCPASVPATTQRSQLKMRPHTASAVVWALSLRSPRMHLLYPPFIEPPLCLGPPNTRPTSLAHHAPPLYPRNTAPHQLHPATASHLLPATSQPLHPNTGVPSSQPPVPNRPLSGSTSQAPPSALSP